MFLVFFLLVLHDAVHMRIITMKSHIMRMCVGFSLPALEGRDTLVFMTGTEEV